MSDDISSAESIDATRLKHPAIDLWLVADDESSEINVHALSPSERQRADRYRSIQKRRQFLFSRYVGREIFSKYLDCSPVEIEWSAIGPPVVSCAGNRDGDSRISVSLSHSGTALAIAVARGHYGIGVDIESTKIPLNVSALAAIVLTENEHNFLREFPTPDQEPVMRSLWTMKEAAIKSLQDSNPPDLRSIQIATQLHAVGKFDWQQDSRTVFSAADRIFDFSIGCFQAQIQTDSTSPVWRDDNADPVTSGICGALAVFCDERLDSEARRNPSRLNFICTDVKMTLGIGTDLSQKCTVMRSTSADTIFIVNKR